MKILSAYYMKSFLKLFVIISIALSIIPSLISLIDNLDELMPAGASLRDIVLYPVLNIPRFFSYIMPLAALLASLFTLGQASRRKEIVALMAAGGRVRYLLVRFVYAGAVMCVAGFALNEFIVPDASRRAEDIRVAAKQRGRSVSREGTVWLRGRDGSIVRLGIYVPDKDMARRVSVFRMSGGMLKERIEADEAVYEAEGWALKNAVSYAIETGSISRAGRMEFPYIEPPSFLEKEVRSPEEMGVFELRTYVRKLEDAGLRNVKLVVDLHSKMSYPLINLFMLIIGVSFSVRRGLGGLLAGAMGIFISLLYWLAYTMSLSLGYAGILHPFLAAWLVPLAFSIVALYLFTTVQE